MKESISAVESACKELAGDEKATLQSALKSLSSQIRIHPALVGAFGKLYGYTSDESGIRHAIFEEPKLSADDAKFFLIICSAFVNFLKAKAGAFFKQVGVGAVRLNHSCCQRFTPTRIDRWRLEGHFPL